MKVELFSRKDERLWCRIAAELTEGRLVVSGHDLGPEVEAFFGRDEYEYFVTIDQMNAEKLFDALGCGGKDDGTKMGVIKDRFSGNYAVSKLQDYCRNHGIEESFWCWP